MSAIIKTVILKDGMPSVEQARARLSSEIHVARQSGIKILKVVHGYGSTGVGGDLRFALQSTLRQMAAKKEIRDCIYGENWRKSDERTWELLKQMPELKADSDLGRGNKGITLVVL
jgi:Smr domain